MSPPKIKPIEYFWSKVPKYPKDQCWEWRGQIVGRKYGRIMIDSKPVPAHRFSYELHYGPIPSGFYVCHKCDNPPCVNPRHLYAGTPKQNTSDHLRRTGSFESKKTSCPKGHPYSKANTKYRADGSKRYCRECNRIRSNENLRKKRQA